MKPENLKSHAEATRRECVKEGPERFCSGQQCMAWIWEGWRTRTGDVRPRVIEADRNGDRLGRCGKITSD